MKRIIFHHPLIVCLFFSMLISMTILPVKAQTPDDFINWLRTHQDSGGTYTLTNDIILENCDYNDADSQMLNPNIIVNTNDNSITLKNRSSLKFYNDNIHFNGNSTIFYLHDDTSLEFLISETDYAGKNPNSMFTKNGPAVQLSDESELFIDGYTTMQADNGTALISEDDGRIYLQNTTVNGNPAIHSNTDITLSLCDINGGLIAPDVISTLSITNDNALPQESYPILYDSIFADADRFNKTLYVNTVINHNLQDMLPDYVEVNTTKLDNSDYSDDLYIPLTYQTLPTLTSADIGKSITISSTLAYTEFQQKLIDQGIIDSSYINPPQIEIQVLENELQFGITFENHFGLCAYMNLKFPPQTSDSQITFEASEDGLHWFTAERSSITQDYTSYDAYVSLVSYADQEGNELQLQYNHTYQFKMNVAKGPMKGTSTILEIKITSDILGKTFYNPTITLPPDKVPPVNQPDQAIPDDDGSIDGNRGGGGQNEGTREHTNTASATSSQANKTQDSTKQADAEAKDDITNDETAILQSSKEAVKCGTDTDRRSTSGDANYLPVICITLGAVVISFGIGFLLYNRKKGV